MAATNKPPPTPIPIRKISILGLILTANNTSIWMIFSFLPFMVADFFPTLSKAELGFKAGIMGSAFSAGGLVGNVLWGTISDRAGRRPALLCGLMGTALSALCFGFSPTFWFAVLSRFAWGLLNGNIGVAKTYLAEISDDSNSARGMALFGVIGGVGRTIGPVLGGFLSSPARTFPSVFGGTVFERFPYALPSLIVSINCLVVLVVAHFELHETLPGAAPAAQLLSVTRTARSPMRSAGGSQYLAVNTADDCDSPAPPPRDEAAGLELEMTSASGKRRRAQVSFSSVVTVQVIGSDSLACAPLKQVRRDEAPLLTAAPWPDDGADNAAGASSPGGEDLEGRLMGGGGEEQEEDDGFVRFSNGSEFNESMVSSKHSVGSNLLYLLRQPEILVSTLLYGLNALAMIVVTEIFPLWVVTPVASGGFAYTAGVIGLSTMICGVVAVLTQLSLYPLLAERLGVLRVYRLGTLLFGAGCFTMPFLSQLNGLRWETLTWLAVVAVSTLVNVTAAWVLICVFVLINNSCYSHQRATVNGIGQTFASLGRVSGPYLGAVTFAWSETNGLAWPLNYHLVWYVLALLAAVNFHLAYLLPRTIQRRKREPRVRTYCGGAMEQLVTRRSDSAAADTPSLHHRSVASSSGSSSNNSGNGSAAVPCPHPDQLGVSGGGCDPAQQSPTDGVSLLSILEQGRQ